MCVCVCVCVCWGEGGAWRSGNMIDRFAIGNYVQRWGTSEPRAKHDTLYVYYISTWSEFAKEEWGINISYLPSHVCTIASVYFLFNIRSLQTVFTYGYGFPSRKRGDEREYFVKWKELGYEYCSWEAESDISAFQFQIGRFKVIQSRRRKRSLGKTKNINWDPKDSKQNANRDSKDLKNKQKEFQHYDEIPAFLSGGMHASRTCIFYFLSVFYLFFFIWLSVKYL